MKQRVARDPDGIRYYNPERSCKECRHYPCLIGHENLKADFAKYGCTMYD